MTRLNPYEVGAKQRTFIKSIELSSQASGTSISLGTLPDDCVVMPGTIVTDTSLGSATISIGTSASNAKYKASATFTSTDTPTAFGKADAIGVVLDGSEDVNLYITTAALPASGDLKVIFSYLLD